MLLSSLAVRMLHLPAFGLAVFLMYWSVPLGMLMGHIKTLKFSGSRNDAYGWCDPALSWSFNCVRQPASLQGISCEGPRVMLKVHTCSSF